MPDRPYSELRKEIFGGNDNAAPTTSPSFEGMSYADFKANHLNAPTVNETESSPFTSTVKSTSAGILNSLAGQPVEDIGKLTGSEGLQNFGKGVREYAEGVQKANPSQINSLGDIVDKPVTAVKTALGNLVPQVPLSMAGAYAGAKAGAALPLPANLKPIAGAIGAGVGMFAPSYAQEYTEMRGKQHESGQENIGKAALSAIPAAGLETAADYVGLGRLVPNGIAGDVIQEGASRLVHVGKQALKGAGTEAATEYAQTGLEQYGGNEDLTTDQAANERNVSAALGGIGGGVMRGGISAFDQRQPSLTPQPQAEQQAAPEAPKGPLSRAASQANIAPVEVNPVLNPSGQAEQVNPAGVQNEQPTEQPIQSAASDIHSDTTGSNDAMVSTAGEQLETGGIDSAGDSQEDTSKRDEYVNNETGRLLDVISKNDKSPSFGNSVLLKLAKLNGVDSSQYADPKVLLSDIASIHAERNRPQTANDVQYVSPVEDGKHIDSSKPENLENRIHDDTVITKVGKKSLEENEDQFIRRLMRNNRSHTYETAKEAFNKKLAQQQELDENTARPETESTGTDSGNAITSINETGNGVSVPEIRDTEYQAAVGTTTGEADEEERLREIYTVNAETVGREFGNADSIDTQSRTGIFGSDDNEFNGSRTDRLSRGLSDGEQVRGRQDSDVATNELPSELTQPEISNESNVVPQIDAAGTNANVTGQKQAIGQSNVAAEQQVTKPAKQINDELVTAYKTYPQIKALVDNGVDHDHALMAARDLQEGDDGLVKHLAKTNNVQLPERENESQTQVQVSTNIGIPNKETQIQEKNADGELGDQEQDSDVGSPENKETAVNLENKKNGNVKPSWQMTSDEFANEQLNKSGYRKSYESDEKLKNDYLQSQKTEWKKALEERAQEGKLPDEVIDDFVSTYGQAALNSTFRGTKEKGIKGWMPKDIREQESPKPRKLTVSEKPTHERTWQQHLSKVKKTISRKLSRQELKEEQDNWNNAIIKAQNDGKQIPDAVIKNRDLIYAKRNEPSQVKEVTDNLSSEQVDEKQKPGNELESFAKNYRSYGNDKKEEIKQMMHDMVKTKKKNGQPYQNLVDRIAIANQIDSSSEEVDTDSIYAERASGHPENQDHALTKNLIPIKIKDTESAARKLDRANEIYSIAVGKLAKAKYDLSQAKTAAAKKKAKAEITRLQDKEGIHEDSVGALRDETIPALERLYKEAKKKYGEEKQTTTSTVDDKTTTTSREEQGDTGNKAELAPTGKPYPTEKSAKQAISRRKDINHDTHEIVSVDGGYGIAPKSQTPVKDAQVDDKPITDEVSEEDLIAHGLLYHDPRTERWKYKFHHDSSLKFANSKESAIERAREAFKNWPESERKTKAQQAEESDRKREEDIDKRYSSKSVEELEKLVSQLEKKKDSLYRAGQREFNGNGGRRTSAAVSSEAARDTAEEIRNIEDHIQRRKAKESEQKETTLDNTDIDTNTDNDTIETEETAPTPSGREELKSIFTQLGKNTSLRSASKELKEQINNNPQADLIKQVQKHWTDVLLSVGYEQQDKLDNPNGKVHIKC
jgi:hypothetical protein